MRQGGREGAVWIMNVGQGLANYEVGWKHCGRPKEKEQGEAMASTCMLSPAVPEW